MGDQFDRLRGGRCSKTRQRAAALRANPWLAEIFTRQLATYREEIERESGPARSRPITVVDDR